MSSKKKPREDSGLFKAGALALNKEQGFGIATSITYFALK